MRSETSPARSTAVPVGPAGTEPQDEHEAAVAAVARHIEQALQPLRELDLSEVWPEAGHGPARGATDAAL